MIFSISLVIGIFILLLASIFLGAVFYHLSQYQLPGKNHKKPIAIIAILFLVFVFVGFWIFSGVNWELL